MRLIYRARVAFKLWLRRVWPVNSFCRECGRDVRDFVAPDDAWTRVQPLIRVGNTLCYECFSDLCRRAGLPGVWRLVPPTDAWVIANRHARGESIPSLAQCWGVSEAQVEEHLRTSGYR